MKTASTVLWICTFKLAWNNVPIHQGWPNCRSWAIYGSSHLCMWLIELSEKLYICFLFFTSIAKCRNIAKWCCGS